MTYRLTEEEALSLPGDAWRTVVRQVGTDAWKHSGWATEQPKAVQHYPSITDRIGGLPASAKWALRKVTITASGDDGNDDGTRAAELIRDGRAIAVSDGSFKDGWGTSAFRITGRQGQYSITGTNIVPGNDEDQCSFRSEAAGLYGIVSMVEVLCQHHDITNGSIEVGCDGEGPLLQCFDPDRWVDSNAFHFDLIMAVRKKLQRSPLIWKFRHIRSHQDTLKEWNTLNRWEKLNVHMDELAGRLRERTNDRRAEYRYCGEIQDAPPGVYVEGNKVVSKLKRQLYFKLSSNAIRTYWTKRSISRQAWDHIDWEAMKRAMKRSKQARKHFVIKHTTEFCPVGENISRWRADRPSHCPRCGGESETATHVLKCKDQRAVLQWATSIGKLTKWMVESKTDPIITNAIITGIRRWRDDSGQYIHY